VTETRLMSLIRALAERPECEHGLNGPCRECGPAVETLAVRRATKRAPTRAEVGPMTTDRDTCTGCQGTRDGCDARQRAGFGQCCTGCTHPTTERTIP